MGDKKLELIHVIFRHGERTPDDICFYRKENESDKYYPYGVAQLTNKGKKDMYELGAYLRQYYRDFLDEMFQPEDVDAWTSEFDRTKCSLMTVLAGLYPPKRELIWNDGFLWQPIPIKYTPVQNDMVFLGCFSHEYRQIYNENFKKSVYGQKLLEDNKDVLAYVKSHTGLEMYNTFQVFLIYDCLSREKLFDKQPDWATDSIIAKLREITIQEINVMMMETTDLKRLFAGFLLEKIVHDSRQMIKGKSTRKIHLYSGHDVNILGILNMLDMLKPHRPEDASCVALELYSTSTGYEIQVKYKSGVKGSFETQLFPGGETSWNFGKLEEKLKIYGSETAGSTSETKIRDRVFIK